MDRPSVSLVLPCLDEAESVAACVTEALDAMRAAGFECEVVVVDNGSTDGSPEIAAAAGARVVHEQRRGYGSALLAGFIPELVAPVVAGDADLVLGSRLDSATMRTMPFLHRYVGTPVLTFLTARACGRRVVTDSQSGFRAFRRDTLPTMGLTTTGMELASEMLIRSARAGLRITEIQMSYRPRVGDSKLSTWSDGWRHLQLIFLLAPDLLLIGPGLLLFGMGVLMLAVAFVKPTGVVVGSLVWQPVFFSGIALVLGLQALLAGAVLANGSSMAVPGVKRRFAFVGAASFPGRCTLVGFLTAVAGLAINGVMFAYWLTDNGQPLSELGLATLSQSLIIVGSTLGTFGLISRFMRGRSVQASIATPRGADDRTPTTSGLHTAPGR